MSSAPVKPPRQLPLDLVHPAALSRDDLIVGPSNREAVGLMEIWPEWPSAVVVLAGPAGSGKTHLATIWSEESGASTVSSADLGAYAIEAASMGPVLVDDIDAQAIDEKGLFHLINAVKQAETSLLLTARRFPMAWGVKLPDLASRLKEAATVEVHEPDDFLLMAVLTKLFADRQVEVEPHVVQFLVRRIERSLSSAMEVVARIDRMALEQKTRITRSLAGQVVEAMDRRQGSLDI